MDKEKIILELLTIIESKNLKKIAFSNFRDKNLELDKVMAKLILIKNKAHIQFEYRHKRILKHINIEINNSKQIKKELLKLFALAKDINIQSAQEIINIKISKKLKLSINRKLNPKQINLENQNRKKSYLLAEDKIYPFLIDLGIQTKDGKIKKDRYAKFKQINKYLEFIENAVKKLDNKKEITILDFASGKSYLTFSTYHYLVNLLNLNVKLIGIDLKKEVIANCNLLAQKLNFKNLEFVCGDVANFNTDKKVDMVISLHACDTATDIAILKSLFWNAKIILAVPCCQKEINSQLKTDFLPFMLKHGIIKEKFATLLTDSIRSQVLEAYGYKSDIIEFISEENTPKNMLIRAFYEKDKIDKNKLKEIKNYLENLNIKMMLIEELSK